MFTYPFCGSGFDQLCSGLGTDFNMFQWDLVDGWSWGWLLCFEKQNGLNRGGMVDHHWPSQHIQTNQSTCIPLSWTGGAPAAIALAQLVEAYLSAEKTAQKIPQMWPVLSYNKIHQSVQQALYAQQHLCLVCTTPLATAATLLYCQLAGCAIFNLQELQVKINLCKSMTLEAARAELGSILKSSMTQGLRLVVLLGSAPPNLRRLCDASQVPMDVFDFEKISEVAQSLGTTCKRGFQLLLLTEMSKGKAEKSLPQLVPAIDEMAVMAPWQRRPWQVPKNATSMGMMIQNDAKWSKMIDMIQGYSGWNH